MQLPLLPPVEPMLARAAKALPPGMAYEPKWDGFRCLVFRDHDDVVLSSRNGKDLSGYFPEVVQAVLTGTPPRCVLDGELVVVSGDRLDFTLLSERIHPSAKRIAELSARSPGSLVFWDLLSDGDELLIDKPFRERRERLVHALARPSARLHLTPLTFDQGLAQLWFEQFEGAGLDGVVAKAPDEPYRPGQRAMVKVKHAREADVVVAGYRLDQASSTPQVSSLQLGLYDAAGSLRFVGASSAFTGVVRRELATLLAELDPPEGAAHPWADGNPDGVGPRATNRWNPVARQTRLIWPMLVCEVGYDHLEGERFRHTAQFRRWRPDREPSSCTFDQLIEVPRFDLAAILGEPG
jgi:ATP-dependent DNA ligase